MERKSIGVIIEVEKEIQCRINAERDKGRERVEKLRKEAESRVNREELRLKESFEKAVQEAKAGAGKRAEEILALAVARSEALETIDEEILKRSLMNRITRILPDKQ